MEFSSLRDAMRLLSPGRRDGRNLTTSEARRCFELILSGSENDIAITAFIVALRCKGVTTEELTGFTLAAREKANIPCSEVAGLVCVCPDLDGLDSRPPLEAAACLVAAIAGARVLLISDRGIPPKRGVTACCVLEELGAGPTWDPSEVEAWVLETGFGAICASGILPALVPLRGVRGSVGMRTPLSTVEKLFAPKNAAVVVGAREGPVLGVAVEVMQHLGHPRAVAIQARDGSVIPNVKKRTRGIEMGGQHITPLVVEPNDFGLGADKEPELPMFGPPAEGKGTGDMPELVRAAAEINRAVLCGETGPARNAVLLGAAVILKTSGRCMTLAEGVDSATSALDSGLGLELVDRLRNLSS